MFTLDPRLKQDTFPVATWELCDLRLMNDARFPWLILVPRIADTRELHQLAEDDRRRLMEEAARAAALLEQAVRPAKINHGALGNLVPQLHWHVVARNPGDPCWPGPVWGCGERVPYEPEALETQMARLRDASR